MTDGTTAGFSGPPMAMSSATPGGAQKPGAQSRVALNLRESTCTISVGLRTAPWTARCTWGGGRPRANARARAKAKRPESRCTSRRFSGGAVAQWFQPPGDRHQQWRLMKWSLPCLAVPLILCAVHILRLSVPLLLHLFRARRGPRSAWVRLVRQEASYRASLNVSLCHLASLRADRLVLATRNSRARA